MRCYFVVKAWKMETILYNRLYITDITDSRCIL